MKPDELKPHEREALLQVLQSRFEQHPQRHAAIEWAAVRARLEGQASAWRSLQAMEATGGEPDVVAVLGGPGQIVFCDCSPESPAGRRSTCYDEAALAARKEHRPQHSAVALAAEMGIRLLTEQQYRMLQTTGAFDLKTSSWIETPPGIRSLGGALFCDRRYDQVFVYHNGAQSYYAARGFRGALQV